jgi:hypothetical protein
MKVIARFEQGFFESILSDIQNEPFTLFVDNQPTDEQLRINPINTYIHVEPNEYFGNHDWITANHYKFDYILTWNQNLLQTCSNTVKVLCGAPAFFGREIENSRSKNLAASFIRGLKHNNVSGHHLRWELWNRRNEITGIPCHFVPHTTPPHASNKQEEEIWFKERGDIFGNFLYHVCIENTSNPNYFTEKILDCFLHGAMPIYYGCPNIGEYFNTDGIITFKTVDQLIAILNSLDETTYLKNHQAIEENRQLSLQYVNWGGNVAAIIKEFIHNRNKA